MPNLEREQELRSQELRNLNTEHTAIVNRVVSKLSVVRQLVDLFTSNLNIELNRQSQRQMLKEKDDLLTLYKMELLR